MKPVTYKKIRFYIIAMTTLDQLVETTQNQDDILILSSDTTRELFNSEVRAEIMSKLAEEEIRSMRHLARRLDREKTNVRKQVKRLVELDILELEDSKFRGAGCKKPILKHDVIIPNPTIRE